MGYGVEIWRWKDREEIERVGERYLRWILRVERRTPRYLMREELQREKLRERAGKRAWEYEKRLEEGRGGELAQRCWEEMKERSKKGKVGSEWEEERRSYFEDRGLKLEELETKRKNGEEWCEDLVKKGKEMDRGERWKRIRNSKYNIINATRRSKKRESQSI